jgi:hypothetical protein
MPRSQAGRQAGSFRGGRRRRLRKKAKRVGVGAQRERNFLARDTRQHVCDLPDRAPAFGSTALSGNMGWHDKTNGATGLSSLVYIYIYIYVCVCVCMCLCVYVYVCKCSVVLRSDSRREVFAWKEAGRLISSSGAMTSEQLK